MQRRWIGRWHRHPKTRIDIGGWMSSSHCEQIVLINTAVATAVVVDDAVDSDDAFAEPSPVAVSIAVLDDDDDASSSVVNAIVAVKLNTSPISPNNNNKKMSKKKTMLSFYSVCVTGNPSRDSPSAGWRYHESFFI
jgi:hypothetical protein